MKAIIGGVPCQYGGVQEDALLEPDCQLASLVQDA